MDGFNGSHMHLQPLHHTRPVHKQRTQPCNIAAGERPTPELAASERQVKLSVHADPQTPGGAHDIVRGEEQEPSAVLDHKEDRRADEEHHFCRRVCEPYRRTPPWKHVNML